MEILLVDDNLERIRHVHSRLPDYCNLTYVTTKEEALEKLCTKFYDIVIIDLIIPEDTRVPGASIDAGKSLIEVIISAQRILAPFQIIGITIEKQIYEENLDFFKDRLIPFIYSDNENKWVKQLLTLITRVKGISDIFTKRIDIAIITAVDEEYAEVLRLPAKWIDYESRHNLTRYKLGEIDDDLGNKISVIAVKLNDMGLVSAAKQTTDIIYDFHPKLVCMCGICAGVEDKVNKGDLIIAEKSWDYGSGKILPKTDSERYYDFDAEPNQISLNRNLLQILQKKCDTYLKLACDEWKNCHTKQYNSNLKFGALPSGAAVVQDDNLIKKIVLPQHRKCLGIDMETYAVYYACHYSKTPTAFLSMKAVVDFADITKSDDYHEYCSFISARTLYHLIKESRLIKII